MHQKCSNYTLTNLLFGLCRSLWIIDPLFIHTSPHLGAPTHPSTPEVLWTKCYLPPLMPLWRFLWARLCEQSMMWGKKEGLLPHMFFPPLLLVEFGTLDMDHSNFLLPTQVRLLLFQTKLLASTTWSPHSLDIPLWQLRSHPRPSPRSMRQSLSPFRRYAYITFSFPLQHNYNRFS